MKTNGATAATTSLTCVRVLLVPPPPVESDFPANSPARTLPTQLPPIVIDDHGWLSTASRINCGPYTALIAITNHPVAYMPSHAPSRLHHSRTPSTDCLPIIPISTTMVMTKASATNGGPHTNAFCAPISGAAAQRCSQSITAHKRAWSVGTATNGAPNAAAMPFQSVRPCIAQNDNSHMDTNTTQSGNGQ